jgi:hypothetical protein
LLVLVVVSWDSSMVSLNHDFTILSNKPVKHQPMNTEPTRNDFGEYFTIIVFDSKNKASLTNNKLRDHIINVSVLVINHVRRELFRKLSLVITKDICVACIILSEETLFNC